MLPLVGTSFSGSSAAPGADPARDAQLFTSFVYMTRGTALYDAFAAGIRHGDASGKSPYDSMEVRRNLAKALAPKTFYRLFDNAFDGSIQAAKSGFPTVTGINPGEALMYTLGFSPTRMEKTFAAMDELWKDQAKMKAMVADLGASYADAVRSNNGDEQHQIMIYAMVRGVDISRVIASANSRLQKGEENVFDRQFKAGDTLEIMKRFNLYGEDEGE
jgi:hypothetical protein